MFKDIPGYDGKYIVNELGEFYSFSDNHGGRLSIPKKLKPYANKLRWGYNYVSLGGHTGRKNWLAHKLVAMVFLPPKPTDKHELNHIDGNKSNNAVSNLEWVTSSENKRHKVDVLGYRHPQSVIDSARKRFSKPIIKKDKEGNVLATFGSAKEAGKSMGKLCGNITCCCRGETHYAYGFKWEYI